MSKRRKLPSNKGQAEQNETGSSSSSSEDETTSPPTKRILLKSNALLPARPLGKPSEMPVDSPPVNPVSEVKIEQEDVETDCEDEDSMNRSRNSALHSNVVDSIRNISNHISPHSSAVGSVEIGGLQSSNTSHHSNPSEIFDVRTENTGEQKTLNTSLSDCKIKTEKLDPGYNLYSDETSKTTENSVAPEMEKIAQRQPVVTEVQSHQSVISEAKPPNNNVQVIIKKEPLDKNFNTNHSIAIENKLLSPPKAYSSIASESNLVSPSTSFSSHNTAVDFSRDSLKYLDLNVYYNLDDIKNCIEHLVTKYNLSNCLQTVNKRSIPFVPPAIVPPRTSPAKPSCTITPDDKLKYKLPNSATVNATSPVLFTNEKISVSSPNKCLVPPPKLRITDPAPVFPAVQATNIHSKPVTKLISAIPRSLATPVRPAAAQVQPTFNVTSFVQGNVSQRVERFEPNAMLSRLPDSFHSAVIPQNTAVCRPAGPVAAMSMLELQKIMTYVKRKPEEQNEDSLSPMKRLKNRQTHSLGDERTLSGFNNNVRNVSTSSIIPVSSFDSRQSTNLTNPAASVISTEESRERNSEISRDPRLRKNITSTVAATAVQHNSQTVNSSPSTSARENFSRHVNNLPNSNVEGHVSKYTRGTDNIPAQDIYFVILEWKTDWLSEQQRSACPPIWSQSEIVKVSDTYDSDLNYSKTYCKLHLLNIWFKIFNAFKNNPKTYECQWTNYEEKFYRFKNTCQSIMPFDDMPIHQGIILVTYTKANGTTHRLFGYVYDVLAKTSRSSMRDVKFSFYTSKKIETFMNSTITIQKLVRVRVAIRQYAALGLTEFSTQMKKVVLNPTKYPGKIKVVELPSHPSETHIDEIMNSAMSPENVFTLVQRPKSQDTIAILKIVRRSLPLGCTILVCLRDIGKFKNIAKTLRQVAVLAVKDSEVDVPEDLLQYTLRSLALSKFPQLPLERAELKVLSTSKIIVTVLSSVFLSDSKTAVLGPDLMCIIDEAHISPEAETALPLGYKPKNAILFGDYNEFAPLHPFLQRMGYHKTLYHRLFK